MSRPLTEDERAKLSTWDSGAYSCACRFEVCERVPCHNDRDDLYTTVERIIAAREKAAWVAGSNSGWSNGRTELAERIAEAIETDPAIRLGHNVSVVCSCLRCEVAQGAARIARSFKDGGS